MPRVSDNGHPDRAKGSRQSVHPRLDGDIILAPDDILEGDGEFIDVDPDGNPVGWKLGQLPDPDGRHVYIGTNPASLSRQTHRPLGMDRPSHLVDYELIEGQPPPKPIEGDAYAKVPRPESPVLKAITVNKLGYPASTPQSPYWYAWAIYDRGRLTNMSPPVAFQLEYGQSIRVTLPDRDQLGERDRIALLLSEPGKSRPNSNGIMRVQRMLSLNSYDSDTYDLTGPYRYAGEIASQTINKSTLANYPAAPRIDRLGGPYAARSASYQARIVWTDASGTTFAGAVSRKVTIYRDEGYTVRDEEGKIEFLSGQGRIAITRPPAPAGATGWYAFLYMTPLTSESDFSAGWRRVMSKFTGRGGITPWTLTQRTIATSGWEGSERYAGNDSVVCVEDELPEANTTGVAGPEEQPELPVAFGPSRPEPDRYFVAVTEAYDGVESVASKIQSINIEADEIFAVVFRDSDNLVPNATFIETDADGDPLYWTIDRSNGYANVDEGALSLGTNAPTTLATPSATTGKVEVDPTKPVWIDLDYSVESPTSGQKSGSLEIVMRQTLSTGSVVETILKSVSDVGDFEDEMEISPFGSAQPALNSAASAIEIVHRIIGNAAGTKNARARVRRAAVRKNRHRKRQPRRRRKPPTPPKKPGPIRIADPPEPPWAPETHPVNAPDRPRSDGAEMQDLSFDAAMPTGFSAVQTGGATASRDPAAALGATASGLKLKKASAGSLSAAYLEKTFPPEPGYPGRHSIGSYLRNRLAVAPSPGRITMHPLSGADGQNLAWLEASTQAEVVELTVEQQPLAPGNATLNLDTTSYNIPVAGAKEVKDLTVTSAPTKSGTISVTLDGRKYVVPAGGDQHQFTMTVTRAPSTNGYVSISVGGITRRVLMAKSFGLSRLAQRIKRAGWPGYRVDQNFEKLTFTAILPGQRTGPVFNGGPTRMGVALRTISLGSSETASQLAERLRSVNYSGWMASIGANTNVVRLTAQAAGPLPAGLVSAGDTGAGISIVDVTQGSIDTAEALAAKIRAMAFTGWTMSGSGSKAVFTSTTGGVRQGSSYRPGSTGAEGYIRTLVQGTNADIIAAARERSGEVARRKIMSAVGSNIVFNTDVTVNGVGTDRAVVTVWGSIGDGTPLQHLARFEDVDLSAVAAEASGETEDYSAETVRVGVTEESSANLVWELHVDEGRITDRGTKFFRDHNPFGIWLPQVFCYTQPTQPARDDLLLQEGSRAVIPGKTYTLAAWIRADVLEDRRLRPLFITAHHPDAHETAVGDVTGSEGLGGRTGWTEYVKTFTVPEDCHAITLSSKRIWAAEVAIQEVVLSPGNAPKRTGLYATLGEYVATFQVATPKSRPQYNFWTPRRTNIGATIDDEQPGTFAALEYRSTAPLPTDRNTPDTTAWSTWTADEATVPQRDFVQIKAVMAGPGHDTPKLKNQHPHVEYALMFGAKRISTLLLPDRTEFPGGAAFTLLPEWSEQPPEGRRTLPSGKLFDEPSLFPPVGYLPASQIFLFNAEGVRYLQENWKELFVAEVYGAEALTLKFSGPPQIARETIKTSEDPDGARHAIWRADLPTAEVASALRIHS